MKNHLTLVAIVLGCFVNAQLLVDDFETGNMEPSLVTVDGSSVFVQTGNSIIGNKRRIQINLDKNPFGQSFQTSIREGLLAVTAPYDTKATFYLLYGNFNKETVPLELDLSKHTYLHIRFAAKSTVNGFYAMLFTGTSRAVYSKQLPAKEGAFVYTVPLSDFKKIGPKYRLTQIDGIRFQFDSRSKTGCSMAIDRIWFE